MSTTASSAAETAKALRASPRAFAKAVLFVTLIAGTLDIVAAHLHSWAASGKLSRTMLKSIAGGALGRERAMQGGVGTMALGLFFHFLISFAFTLLFFLLFPRVTLLRKNRVAVGTGYALFTWAVMSYLVLPLSALPWRPPNFANKHTYIGWVVLTLVFGLPIVFGASRFFSRNERGKAER